MRLNNIRILREKCHKHCANLKSEYCNLFNSKISEMNRCDLCISLYGIINEAPNRSIRFIKEHYNRCAQVHKNEIDWRDLKIENHKQHLLDHVDAFKNGDCSDTHLENIILRALMIKEILMIRSEK